VVAVQGRFWPAADLGKVADLGAGGLAFWDFLGGASGAGHSTSWVRSRRAAGIHSGQNVKGSMEENGSECTHHRDVC